MELNQLYKAMFETVGCMVNEQGEVVDTADNKVITIKGKKLVLPTKENLSKDTDKTIRFHPLLENQHAGETVVVNRYRKMAANHVNTAAAELIERLLTLVGSEAMHPKIHPDYAGVVTDLGHVKESTMIEFGKIVDAVVKAGAEDHFLVKLFIKKNGSIGKQAFKRVGVVSFPLYESLVNGEDPYGVKLGVRNRAILIKALSYIFPNISEPHAYSHGSASTLAPTIDALMGAIDKVFGAISAKQRVYAQMDLGDLFKDQMVYVNHWAEAFGDIDEMTNEARKVPSQPGNEGTVAQAAATTQPTADAAGMQIKVSNGDAGITQTLVAPQQQTNVVTTPTLPLANQPLQQQPLMVQQQQPVATQTGVAYGEVLQRRAEQGMFGNVIGKQYPQAVAEQYMAQRQAQMLALNPGMLSHSNPYAQQNGYVTAGNMGMAPMVMAPAVGGGQPY